MTRAPYSMTFTVLSAIAVAAVPAHAQESFPPDSFTNLQVLPSDTKWAELIPVMAGFTRALGVRCSFCHQGEEGRPLATYDFASDDKLAKRKARAMLRMVDAINSEYLADLPERSRPRIRVECATCHRGTREPRMLQDVLLFAYAGGGLDSAVRTYRSLKERFYGRFTYDFGDVPLVDVAQELNERGAPSDAVELLDLNVAEHPGSAFAKRQHASAALLLAYSADGVAAGDARYRALRQAYGDAAFPEGFLNRVGYALLADDKVEEAIAVFTLNVEAFPASANVYDSLGEAYVAHGDSALAAASYERSLNLDPDNRNAVEMLAKLRPR